MAIATLVPTTWQDFSGGRVTNRNLAGGIATEESLVASNVVFLGDAAAAKRSGYTKKLNLGQDGSVLHLFDFQRDSDGQQFILAQQQQIQQSNCSLFSIKAASLAQTVLSTTEDRFAEFDMRPLDYAAYLSNGIAAYRMVDNAGTNVLYKWGIAAPAAAPTVATPAGVLTLTYGRQYVYCYVSKIIDGLGVTRISVGLPSPISASTGPITSKTPTLTLVPSADGQVTHIWIFSTYDTPAGGSAVFLFDGEVTAATTSFGDTVVDASLDATRLAPFQNYPAPAGNIIRQFANRMAVTGILGSPTLVQLSGFEEIGLGIPQEAFPPSVSFKVPGGKQSISGMEVFLQQLFIGTQDFWWAVQGYDVETFTKSDRLVSPGPVGKKATVVTPQYLVYVGKDRKLWAWDGVNIPICASDQLMKALPGSLSMEDLSASELANIETRYYSFGRYNLIMLLCNTGTAPQGQFDWVQLWDASFIGKTLDSGAVRMLGESDMFPSHVFACSANVDDNNQAYMYFGDAHGNVYRWPDGYNDAGLRFAPVLGSGWSGLRFLSARGLPIPADNVDKQLDYLDLRTDRIDCADSFKVWAIAMKTPNMIRKLVQCQVRELPDDADEQDPMAARADLEEPGVSSGMWFRWLIQFPIDDNPATLYKVSVGARPLGAL